MAHVSGFQARRLERGTSELKTGALVIENPVRATSRFDSVLWKPTARFSARGGSRQRRGWTYLCQAASAAGANGLLVGRRLHQARSCEAVSEESGSGTG